MVDRAYRMTKAKILDGPTFDVGLNGVETIRVAPAMIPGFYVLHIEGENLPLQYFIGPATCWFEVEEIDVPEGAAVMGAPEPRKPELVIASAVPTERGRS